MLNAMAYGGIHDQLGGGMHRYSTEPTWSVPHFEKMLSDNAQLIGLYADDYDITHEPLAHDMAVDLAGYLARRMTAEQGGFFTAEDAEIEGKEGETYLWTTAEIMDALGASDTDRFLGLYQLTPLPSDPNGPGVLRIRQDLLASKKSTASLSVKMAELAPLCAKLLEVREQRPQLTWAWLCCAWRSDRRASLDLARSGSCFGHHDPIYEARRAARDLDRRRKLDRPSKGSR